MQFTTKKSLSPSAKESVLASMHKQLLFRNKWLKVHVPERIRWGMDPSRRDLVINARTGTELLYQPEDGQEPYAVEQGSPEASTFYKVMVSTGEIPDYYDPVALYFANENEYQDYRKQCETI